MKQKNCLQTWMQCQKNISKIMRMNLHSNLKWWAKIMMNHKNHKLKVKAKNQMKVSIWWKFRSLSCICSSIMNYKHWSKNAWKLCHRCLILLRKTSENFRSLRIFNKIFSFFLHQYRIQHRRYFPSMKTPIISTYSSKEARSYKRQNLKLKSLQDGLLTR